MKHVQKCNNTEDTESMVIGNLVSYLYDHQSKMKAALV